MSHRGKNDQISRIVSLIFTVRNLSHEKIAQKKDKKSSFLQMVTLRFIKENKPTMKEIADYLLITAPSATSLINNLIKEETIKREEDKEDRRIVRIVISKKGEEYLKKGMECISEKIGKNLEVLNEKEKEELARILAKVVNHLRTKEF